VGSDDNFFLTETVLISGTQCIITPLLLLVGTANEMHPLPHHMLTYALHLLASE